MDKPNARKKGAKQPSDEKRKKTKPIKVVYISNPKKIVTTPAEFKGCVQLYTGKDSDVARAFESDDPPPDHATSSGSTGFDSASHVQEHVDVDYEIFAGLHGLDEPVAMYHLPFVDDPNFKTFGSGF